jgi:eukaryotic-like serine/threonine-protein kinase
MNGKSQPTYSGASDGVVAGRYRLIRLLGEGERKRTYLAEDTVVGRQVALAMVKPEALHSDPRGTAREVEAICQTGGHDNIVTLHDRGTADGSDYLVFEYLSGGNLRDYLADRRHNHEPITPEELRRLGRQLARALSHVHARGLLHRDVAPANIWLDERHVAHLGDFDSAMPLNASPGMEGARHDRGVCIA